MREPTFLILTSLADGPRHGYGIIQQVAVISAGRVNLLPGTLYTALDRLAGQGLVERGQDEIIDGRLRRYYCLTANGITALEAESKRMQQLVAAAETRLSVLRPRTSS